MNAPWRTRRSQLALTQLAPSGTTESAERGWEEVRSSRGASNHKTCRSISRWQRLVVSEWKLRARRPRDSPCILKMSGKWRQAGARVGPEARSARVLVTKKVSNRRSGSGFAVARVRCECCQLRVWQRPLLRSAALARGAVGKARRRALRGDVLA